MACIFIIDTADDGPVVSRYSFDAENAPHVIDILRAANADIAAPCGGGGRCGRCVVYVSDAVEPPDESECELLSRSPLPLCTERDGVDYSLRLACRVRPIDGCRVLTIPSGYSEESCPPQTFHSANGENDALLPAFAQLSTTFPPFDVNKGSPQILQCGINVENSVLFSPEKWSLAIDLGTTTVGMRLLHGAETVCQRSAMNRQYPFGADVISRISYCSQPGGLELLSDRIRSQLGDMAAALCASQGLTIQDIDSISAAGNTTMQYILCGVSPVELGVSPYIPSERFGRCFELNINGTALNTYLPPCTGGFTGGDLTCCLVALNACSQTENIVENLGITVETSQLSAYSTRFSRWKTMLLCDLGTNGELALYTERTYAGRRILVTSAAAGPALEGGCISCGSGAVDGAISHIREMSDSRLEYDVIGAERGCEARTLSGGALLELTAILLRRGIIDETGRMECGEYTLCEGITLTQQDVRQLQLAKGAIHAAALRLLEIAGLSAPDGVVITGGLGYRISAETVAALELLPMPSSGNISDDIVFAPSLALDGAALCCLDEYRRQSISTAARCECIDLSADDRFDELFVEHMEFSAPFPFL